MPQCDGFGFIILYFILASLVVISWETGFVCLIFGFVFPNERQRRSGSRVEERWVVGGRSRGMENCNQDPFYKNRIYFQ